MCYISKEFLMVIMGRKYKQTDSDMLPIFWWESVSWHDSRTENGANGEYKDIIYGGGNLLDLDK